jgi:S1-C subfamily serine protease
MLDDVTVIAANANTDLALLWVRANAGQTYSTTLARLASGTVSLGERVTAYGYPLSGTLASSGTFSTGTLSATAGFRDDPTRLQFSAPIQPGNSGGALLDERGRLIGIVQAQLNPIGQGRDIVIPQNVNFAVKAAALVQLLEANGYKILPGSSTDPVLDAKALAGVAQEMTGQVLCYRSKLEADFRGGN